MPTDSSMIQPSPRRTRQKSPGPGIPSHALNDALIQYAEVDISSAEVLLLNSAPKVCVPAPGVGRVLEFVSAVLILDHAGTDYASNGICNFLYETTGTIVSDSVAAAAFLHQADDAVVACQALSAEVELVPNEGLALSVDTGEVDTGNSPVRVKVAYRVHNTGL